MSPASTDAAGADAPNSTAAARHLATPIRDTTEVCHPPRSRESDECVALSPTTARSIADRRALDEDGARLHVVEGRLEI